MNTQIAKKQVTTMSSRETACVAQEIIPIEQGDLGLMVNSRLLHNALQVNTKFADWIKRRIDEYEFVENEDYEVFLKFEKNLSGGRPVAEYAITLDMAKELAMVERNHYGRAIREALKSENSRFSQESHKKCKQPT